MTVWKTELFGDVTLTEDGAYIAREPDAAGRTRRPSLYVAGGLSRAWLDQATPLVDDIASLDERARRALVDSVESGDKIVVDFIAFHRDELDADTVRLLFGDASTPGETIARLDLVGLGVRGEAFVLDYSFGRAQTDQLLVVAFDARRNVVSVSHES